MPTLYDMLNNAQNGQGMDLLARQFNLSRQQAELAVEALAPAFSQGLKQNASDPYGIAGFLQALSTGQHAKYFEDAQAAFTPQGVAEGNGILGHLFGSKDLSRAVASQAAQATGIGQNILQQMLPVIASMIMGGLFKQSSGQVQQAQAASNPFGQILEQMMRQGGGMTGQPQGRAPGGATDNPFGQILEGMFGGGGAQGQRAPAGAGDNPFGQILEQMMRQGGGMSGGQPQGRTPGGATDNPLGQILEGMFGGGAAQGQAPRGGRTRPADPSGRFDDRAMGGTKGGSAMPPPQEPAQKPAAGRARNPYDDLFGDMFDAGAKTRDDYQKSVESIFEQFTRGMDRHR